MSIQEEKDSTPHYRCPFCGVQIFQNTRFCHHCGQPIHEGDAVETDTEAQSPPFPEKQPDPTSFSMSASHGISTGFDDSTKDNPYVSPPLPSPGNHGSSSINNLSELSRRISRGWKNYSLFWNITFAILILFFLVLLISGIITDADHNYAQEIFTNYGYLVIIAVIITGVSAFICGLVLLHRLWQVVPSGMAATTPDRAVGFLFIPFFNVYWIFIAYYQLAKHYHVLTKLAGQETNREALACVRNIFCLIPRFNVLLGPLLTMSLLLRLHKDALFVLENYPKLTEGNNSNDPSMLNENKNKAEYSLVIPTNTSALAIAAGYLGLFSLIVFPAPVAIIVGALALRKLKQNPGMFGYGRAWFGIIMGSLVTLGVIAFIIIGSLG